MRNDHDTHIPTSACWSWALAVIAVAGVFTLLLVIFASNEPYLGTVGELRIQPPTTNG